MRRWRQFREDLERGRRLRNLGGVTRSDVVAVNRKRFEDQLQRDWDSLDARARQEFGKG